MSTKQAKLPDHFVLEDLGDAAINFFIDLLQKHPIVWNKSLPGYKNNIKKGLAFKEMDVEMRTAGHTSKAGLIPTYPLYSLIRKRYQREWGRINYRPSGSSPVVQKWKYFDALSFLHAHIEDSSRRIHTGFDPGTSNFYETEQPGPSRLNAVDSQEYEENALDEFFVGEHGYLTLAPVVAETHQPIQMSSSETNAVYLMETPKTAPNEAIFAPGWRKRKMNEALKQNQLSELKTQIEVLKSLKETNPTPTNTAMLSINQKYIEIWASRLDALPYNSQVKVRRNIEVLFEEESKQNRF